VRTRRAGGEPSHPRGSKQPRMPCYRCGVRQTDPSRGQSPWKRGVRRQSQILICPGCQDTVDWVSDLDRCSRCSSVHLVKRLGEVECRDCGAIASPEGSGEPGSEELGSGEPGFTEQPGFAEQPGFTEEPGRAGPAVAGRGPDLSEEVARALDRVLSRSLVSQSIQRASAPEGRSDAASGGSGAGSGSASGSGSGRRRPARTPAEHHAAAQPGAFAG
jgi:hypothetical protein